MTPLRFAGKAQSVDLDDWLAGKVPRTWCVIPYGGPIPSPDGKGRDLDGEFFDEKTDTMPDLFEARPVIWHHGKDPTGVMGPTVLGKAVDPREDEIDGIAGIWADVWLRQGEKRVALVRKLAERDALYGSTAPLKPGPPFYVTGKGGHIDRWGWAELSLSTSPQNTYAVPAKATLEHFDQAGISLDDGFRFLLTEWDAIASDLRVTFPDSGSELAAKAGRVLSAANERILRDALDGLGAVIARLEARLREREASSDGRSQGDRQGA